LATVGYPIPPFSFSLNKILLSENKSEFYDYKLNCLDPDFKRSSGIEFPSKVLILVIYYEAFLEWLWEESPFDVSDLFGD
jgi:hypothetical protein